MQKRPKFFTDRFAAKIFLFFILAYLGWAGYLIMQAGSNVAIEPRLFIMLLPVLLTDGIKTAIESFTAKKHLEAKEDLTKVTVVIPTYNGERVLGATIKDLLQKFPQTSVIVASNGSTDKSCEIAARAGVRVLEIPRAVGKVEAINQALSMVTTPYCLIMDDDTLVGDAIIPTSALDQGYQGVAFTVLPVKQGFWSKIQMHEYRKSMSVGRNYHNHSATVQNISGAIGLFRTDELRRQAKIHTGEFSGEDLQRTLLIHLSHSRGGVVMTDSVVETLVPGTFSQLYSQRVFGWYPGFLANFNKYFKLIFKKRIPWRLRFEAFYNVFVLAFLDPVRLLSLPVLLFHPVYLIFFYFVYVLLELIPYIRMGSRDPLWVIFFFPPYGIFNFITRVLSMAVFFYRRSASKLGRAKTFDDYKFVKVNARIMGALLSSVTVLAITTAYGLVATELFDLQQVFLSQAAGILPKKELAVTTFASGSQRKVGFKYIVNKGDSRWSLSQKAVDEYIQALNLQSKNYDRGQFTYLLAQTLSNRALVENEEFYISLEAIEEAEKNLVINES